MRSGNPVLSHGNFSSSPSSTATMTIQGTVNKTLGLLFLAAAAATYVWSQFFAGQDVSLFIMVGILGGLVLALITAFVPKAAPISAPLYALVKGLAVGGISAFFEAEFPGIVIQAVSLTFAVLFTLLLLYKARVIRVTKKFRTMVMAATGAIFIVYLVNIVLRLFTSMSVPFIHDSGPLGIGISMFIVGVAAMNLVIDFDYIERGVRNHAAKNKEWYAAFGLLVTLIWLYLEILRLLAKLKRR
ncbi:Bax inhibitor-1/YccA family protein [Evansella halocellulosilytica]|uniref:Bax inhibitor-1/YccA family protein n=1 Tax=Evansella halocellulosilytica TaxID=2011013 RepID=UPI000BB8A6AE|nr:Bax inhibitor-1/YccA family protein [Evansella halocellulosilytica]